MASERAIVFAGGGTGGHVFPGLAVARELERRLPGRPIVWIGAEGGLEDRLVPRAGLPLVRLKLAGMARMGALHGIWAVALAGLATLRLLARFAVRRPGLLVGVGGFASGPAVLAGAMVGAPALLLEQNAVPGGTNRYLSRWASAVAASFEGLGASLRGRVVVTGNPVRDDVASIGPRRPGPVRVVLGFGGSRGAHPLNQAWCGALPLLADLPVSFVLQTGPDDLDVVTRAAAAVPGRAEVVPFLDDLPARLAGADLVVSRAGATTVAELTAAGRAAILVPFPGAANDHQLANARALADAGAAIVLEQRDLTPGRLAAEVRALATAPDRIDLMARAARAMGRPDAAVRVADLAEELLGTRPGRAA